VMTKGARGNASFQADFVLLRQQLGSVPRAAQRVQSLLDSPKVALREARQRQKFFYPLQFDRIAMDDAEAAIYACQQFESEPGPHNFGIDRVGAIAIRVE